MRYLTPSEVEYIHQEIISTCHPRGSWFFQHNLRGPRGPHILASGVNCIRQTFEGRELYTDIYQKAASLTRSLIKNHPFFEGNKRTAVIAAALFLRMNGYELCADDATMGRMALRVARASMPDPVVKGLLEQWFRKYSRNVAETDPYE